MEPISLIIAALIAGATAATKDTAEKAVKDAYEGLKTLIKRKLEGDPIGQGLVDAEPEKIKKGEELLKDSIKNADVDQDEEVLKAAKKIMEKEDPEGASTGKYNIKAEQIKGIVGDISGGNVNQTIS